MRTHFLGHKVPYEVGMAAMRQAMANIDALGPQLLLLEHEDVITTTRQHGQTHLLAPPEFIEKQGIRVIETDRGGDVTFHGRGQLVGYPVLRLHPSVGAADYVRALERTLLHVCETLGVVGAHTLDGFTGIWIKEPISHREKKLIAIGVGISRGVTRHGFALNIHTELERFTACITPCGLASFGVTSLEREMAENGVAFSSFSSICDVVAKAFEENFDHRMLDTAIS
jgi:lipoyl(octanoyl) transferase